MTSSQPTRLNDEDLVEFIDYAERHIGGDEWWLDDFFQEAKQVGEELKYLRENLARIQKHALVREVRALKERNS